MTKDEAVAWAVDLLKYEFNFWHWKPSMYPDAKERADKQAEAMTLLSGKQWESVLLQPEGFFEQVWFILEVN